MIQRVAPIQIRVATPADAIVLSEFAARTFIDTFAADNSPDDTAAYVAATFTPELQAAELADRNAVVLVAADASGGDALIAYAHVGDGGMPRDVTGQPAVELKRFYVASEWHGRGIAQQLMQHVFTVAVQRGARTLWLGVWERNARAIAFYEKCGFERVGEQPFRLGNDVQTDWIMQHKLGSGDLRDSGELVRRDENPG